MGLIGIFAAYLLALLLIGEWSGRRRVRSLDDYLLAGRAHGPVLITATVAATVVGAGSTLGAAGVAYYLGLSGAWYLLSASIGLVTLGLTLGPVMRRLALYTVPQFITRRYGPRAGRLAAGLAVLGLVLFVAAQFYAMGALLAELTGWHRVPVTISAALVVVLYTVRGGLWAVHVTDLFQIGLIVAGVVLVLVTGLRVIGGLPVLERPPAAAGFPELGGVWFHPLERRPVSGWSMGSLGNTVFAWIVMSTTWHFAMQSTAQRLLAARDPATVRRACLGAAVLLAPLALAIALAGMVARVVRPDLAPGAGLEQVRALPALVQAVLHPVPAGVVLAALVAVIMSTSDSALLGASTIWLTDLFPGRGRTDPVGRSRQITALFGGLALVLALLVPTLIRMLETVAAVYCVALFVPLVAGLYWHAVPEAGAIAAMIASGAVGLVWRMSGWETGTGVHMLNVSLPAAVLALLVATLVRRRADRAE